MLKVIAYLGERFRTRLRAALIGYSPFFPTKCHHTSDHDRKSSYSFVPHGRFIYHNLIFPMTVGATE